MTISFGVDSLKLIFIKLIYALTPSSCLSISLIISYANPFRSANIKSYFLISLSSSISLQVEMLISYLILLVTFPHLCQKN